MNMLQECVTISLFCSSDSSICLLTNAYKDAVAHLVCYLICLL